MKEDMIPDEIKVMVVGDCHDKNTVVAALDKFAAEHKFNLLIDVNWFPSRRPFDQWYRDWARQHGIDVKTIYVKGRNAAVIGCSKLISKGRANKPDFLVVFGDKSESLIKKTKDRGIQVLKGDA